MKFTERWSGFLEAVYQEWLEREFTIQGIPFKAQKELVLNYKGENLNQTYKPDFICYDCIVVEIQAVDENRAESRRKVRLQDIPKMVEFICCTW